MGEKLKKYDKKNIFSRLLRFFKVVDVGNRFFDKFFVVSKQSGQKKSYSTNCEQHFRILDDSIFLENFGPTDQSFTKKHNFL